MKKLLQWIATPAVLALTVLAMTAGTRVMAQGYPAKPVRILIETTTGSTNDIWSRRFAQRLGDVLGQSFVVDAKPGASGTIAAETMARSTPDGLTLFFGGMTALITYPSAGGVTRYQPAKDFVPIALGTMGYPMVVASAKLGAQNLAQLLEKARARGGELICGTAGQASPQHFACAQFAKATGIRIRAIPYKGGAAALLDAANGDVDIAIGWSSELEPFTSAKRLIAVTTMGPTRHPKYGQVPTLAEAGYAATNLAAFSGLFAPAGTPQEIIDRLNAEMVRAALRPEMKEWMEANGGIYMPMNAAEFGNFFRSEQSKWKRIAEEGSIRLE